MLTRKCDICGAEMRMTTPRYKVAFDGWLYTQEKDICTDCFKRIADEIKQADTPQTDLSAEEFVEGMKNLKMEVKQTDCEACELDGKADVCKICRVSNYEPQTDCAWK